MEERESRGKIKENKAAFGKGGGLNGGKGKRAAVKYSPFRDGTDGPNRTQIGRGYFGPLFLFFLYFTEPPEHELGLQ